ncbi:MAG: STAS/SEC14 domain-containing protein [Gammaproteobacteria bacterium]|nr:STAS/SEC14 domain-containing protein [Gammaproteobacteria bacterium]MBU1415049.1 STAS/SEC14 domain-containing protein [Gammaproteobacteria bacterium]
MITTDQTESQLSVAVLGEFTLGDFQEFEDLVLGKVSRGDTPDLLFDLREMADFTVDMAWEEIKFSRQHASDFRRIAVLTDSQWVAWSAWIEQLFLKSDVRVFADEAEARAWLAEGVAA